MNDLSLTVHREVKIHKNNNFSSHLFDKWYRKKFPIHHTATEVQHTFIHYSQGNLNNEFFKKKRIFYVTAKS